MQKYEKYRGARHRILILLYISGLTLSLSPAMTPPEKGFKQGQPEMQLSMDNMVAHKSVIKKRVSAPLKDGGNYQTMFTHKTSNLLEEAENVLKNIPNPKERQWIESFVHRMRAIATTLEKTAQNAMLPKRINSVSGTPVPEGIPPPTALPATSAVSGIGPFQKPGRITSKFPVTSPELSRVLPDNEYPSERQVVTKPAMLSSNQEETESDELVRELESLHQEYHPQHLLPLQNSKVLNEVPDFTTPPFSLITESDNAIPVDNEEQKAKLKSKLIEEIAEYRRLGGIIPRELINALYSDNQKATDPIHNRNINIEESMKYTDVGMVDRRGMQRLNDLDAEDDEITKINLPNIPHHAEQQFQNMKFNHTFQNSHPNYLQAFNKKIENYFENTSPQNKEQFYRSGIPNGVQEFQKTYPYNQEKYHAMPAPNYSGHIPDAMKQKLSGQHNNFYNEQLAASDFNKYLLKHSYGPYPYMHSGNPENETFPLQPGIPLHQSKTAMNLKMDAQLSDEMKRELRDGKIIVLSDSVVRSNFETNNNEKNTESTPENIDNKKNETITEK